jgi:hypothetical protein
MFTTTSKRAFIVNDEDMRNALRGMYRYLRQTRTVKEARRQLNKMVQFGLYDSEKQVTDLATPVQTALAV